MTRTSLRLLGADFCAPLIKCQDFYEPGRLGARGKKIKNLEKKNFQKNNLFFRNKQVIFSKKVSFFKNFFCFKQNFFLSITSFSKAYLFSNNSFLEKKVFQTKNVLL